MIKRGGAAGAAGKIAARTGVSEITAEIAASRGLGSADEAERFFNPSEADLFDPYLLQNMDAVAARIRRAACSREKIVVYGDYDADGICSAVMLVTYLSSLGCEAVPYIPNRTADGYGLNTESLSRIIGAENPGLIVTCDCGISGAREIAAAGAAEFIVTDHHEPPAELPNCLIINPKIGNYPFPSLCGAGVALKIITAVSGIEEARNYYGLAAVATVADLVPLVSENRAIAAMGIKAAAEGNCPLGLLRLLKRLRLDKPSSGDFAYKVAPRLNAAGRMGDAGRAYELLATRELSRADALIAELEADNDRRKIACDVLYAEAVDALKSCKMADKYAIIIAKERWERGLTSIVAARLAAEYCRPTFIMAVSGDCYKGTARGIEGVNLYELLGAVSGILTEYGGHAQAAGFSLEPENLNEFERRVNLYLKENCASELFLPKTAYDAEACASALTPALCRELEILEPFGHSNPRPVFLVKARAPRAEAMRGKQHLIITAGAARILAYNRIGALEQFQTDGTYEFAVELSLSEYRGIESVTLSLVNYNVPVLGSIDKNLETYYNSWQHGKTASEPERYTSVSFAGLETLKFPKPYGTAVRAPDIRTYLEFLKICPAADGFMHCVGESPSPNNLNRVSVGANFEGDLSGYDRIVLLSPPPRGFVGWLNGRTDAEVIVAADRETTDVFAGVSFLREDMLTVYRALVRAGDMEKTGMWDCCRQLADVCTPAHFVFALLVFIELGIVKEYDGVYRIDASIQTELNCSPLYRRVAGME